MKTHRIYLTVALASLFVAGAPAAFNLTPLAIPPASAAAKADIGVFYDALAPYGSWVSFKSTYVFVPSNVEANWRPYTVGHWSYAAEYGWTWNSTEPFGAITYHYGRWGFDETIGWYWVPGNRWAPAWVAWRRGAGHVVWAPLPPENIVPVTVETLPAVYWVAVPEQNFLDADLTVVIRQTDRDRDRLVTTTRFLGAPRVENNIVINNEIQVNVIEKVTKKKVERVKLKEVNSPTELKAGGGEAVVVKGELAQRTDAKPKNVKKPEEVKSKAGGGAAQGGNANNSSSGAGTGNANGNGDNINTGSINDNASNGNSNAGADKTNKSDAGKLQNQQNKGAANPSSPTNGQGAAGETNAPASGKQDKAQKNKLPPAQTGNGNQNAGSGGQTNKTGQGAVKQKENGKKKQGDQQNQQGGQQNQQGGQQQNQQGGQQKEQNQQSGQQQYQQGGQQNQQGGQQQNKKPKANCDPNAKQNC